MLWKNPISHWFYGTETDDVIYGSADNDALYGLGGDDHLYGQSGADVMIGGIGDDAYYVDNPGDAVVENAGEGHDKVISSIDYTLPANVEDLFLYGGAISGTGNELDNYIHGNENDNVLAGGGGDDWIVGSAGADTMIGGKGDDHFSVDQAGDVVIENYREGNDTVSSTISYTLGTWVENLELEDSGGAINGTGNDLDNELVGNSSNNILTGGDGDDWIVGGGGADTMIGGKGNDAYTVDHTGDVVIENYREGTDTVYALISYTLGTWVENLVLFPGTGAINGTGNGLDNQIAGNESDNILVGGGGDDQISGFGGADTMIGGTGNDTYFVDNGLDQVSENPGEGTDTIYSTVHFILPANVENLMLDGGANANGSGNALANSLVGDSSDNVLDGQGNADTLRGNAGNDTFVFNVGQANGDTVLDFAGNGASAGDSLHFIGYGAGATFTQNDATHWQVNFNGGASHEVITFMNGAIIDPSDVLFS